ncbi:ABC transporter permease [Salinibacterium sp. TMP30]|uniref:ABC transporter permease n=1 Tax=Salinibacterium sp. TMP30 TaxID=3138237 RepID=UPI003138C2EF
MKSLAFLQQRSVNLAIVIAMIAVAVAVTQPAFTGVGNIRNILLDITIITVMAATQVLVVITGNFDISIGATTGLSAMSAGIVLQNVGDFPAILVFVISIGVGLLVGIVNAILVITIQIPSIILTLGMLSVIRGVTFYVAGGSQVNTEDVPESIISLSQSGPFGVPWLVVIAALIALALGVFARSTSTGRNLYALGSNPKAAALQGLPVKRLLFLVFALSGASAGLAGAFYLSRFGFVQVNAGLGLELTVIAAVVVGGASVFGGVGGVAGAALGCLLLGVIGNAFAILGISQYWQDFAYGTIILLAVVADAVLNRSRARGVNGVRA